MHDPLGSPIVPNVIDRSIVVPLGIIRCIRRRTIGEAMKPMLATHDLVQSLAFLRLMKSPTFSGRYFGGLSGP